MDRRPPLVVSPRRLRPRPHRAPRPPLVPSSSVKTPPGSTKKAAASMRASVCAMRSPLRHQLSSMRASVSALPAAARLDLSPPRTKLDLPLAAVPSPAAARAVGKENVPAAASPQAWPAGKEDDYGYGPDSDERMSRDLAALARATTPVTGFVRGRLYNVYSARRDERLKRKQGFPYSSEWESPEAIAQDPCVAVELSKRRVAKKASTGADSVRRSMPANEIAAGRASSLGTRSSLRSSKEMKKPSAASGAVSMAVERRLKPRSSARRI